MMKDYIRLLVVALLIFGIPATTLGNEIQYNHDSLTIAEIKKKVDFTVLVPQQVPVDWTLENKTYPLNEVKGITSFRLHYMNYNDEEMMEGIEQSKASAKVKYRNPNDKIVEVNGNKGYLAEWGNSGEYDRKDRLVKGGVLSWTQNGTFIEMVSMELPTEEMLKIARSIK